jgi:hypothetical protein
MLEAADSIYLSTAITALEVNGLARTSTRRPMMDSFS